MAKRHGNLFERICEPENLYLAYRKARLGKSVMANVQRFERDVAGNLEAIRQSLVDKSFTTARYHSKMIHVPKTREIYILPLDGDKVKLDEVVNREILITGHSIKRSRYDKNTSGKCLTIQFEVGGRRQVLFTGSDVLIEQFEKYGDQIPFAATIKKIDRFYTLS